MVIIVGSGPSLKGKKRGDEIDSYPIVVRTLNTWKSDCEDHIKADIKDHGSKTDYLVVNTSQYKEINGHIRFPEVNTWIISRPGEDIEKEIINKYPRYKPIVCYETWYWMNEFIHNLKARQLLPKFRPIPQTGTLAVISAMARLRPMKIKLAGFDSFFDERLDHREIHDLIAERKLIAAAAEYYKAKVEAF